MSVHILNKQVDAIKHGTSNIIRGFQGNSLVFDFSQSFDDNKLCLKVVVNNSQLMKLGINTNVNCTIDWGDGTITPYTTNYPSHTYTIGGEYIISISGSFTTLGSASTSWDDISRASIIEVLSYGAYTTVQYQYTSYAFNNCVNLIKVCNDIHNISSHWIRMDRMFSGCTSLQTLDLSSYNTINVNTMAFLCYNCINLSSINLTNIITNKVTTMESMFRDCNSLTIININSFITPLLINTNSMFRSCDNLIDIYMDNIDLDIISNSLSMFFSTQNLSRIYARNCGLVTIGKIETQLTLDGKLNVNIIT